jgi:hypothetical protein
MPFLFLPLVVIMMINLGEAEIKQEIEQILARYQAPTVRYRHLVFSSKDMALLDNLTVVLKELLPDYQIWDAQPSQQNSAPAFPCWRKDFIQQAFHCEQGLLIVEPDHWLQSWQTTDKQAFWSALSTRHNGQPVIVVSSENHEFLKLVPAYFSPHLLTSAAVTLWTSVKN